VRVPDSSRQFQTQQLGRQNEKWLLPVELYVLACFDSSRSF